MTHEERVAALTRLFETTPEELLPLLRAFQGPPRNAEGHALADHGESVSDETLVARAYDRRESIKQRLS